MQFRNIDWYEHPGLYDALFADETGPESDFIEAIVRRHGPTLDRTLLEPACGTGRLVAEMANRGWKVTGFDLSETMLGFASRRLRRRKLHADLRVDCMTSFDVGCNFDVACNMLSTIRLLLSASAVESHLKRVADALKCRGLYIFTLPLTDYEDRSQRWERWTTSNRGREIVSVLRGWPACHRKRLESLRCRMTINRGAETDRLETLWQFRTYGPRQVAALVASEPRFRLVGTYGGEFDVNHPISLDGRRCDTTFVLQKVGD